MKTIYFTVIPALLLSAAVCFGDDPVNEPVELRSREQAQDQYHARIDQDEIPALVQAMQRARFSHANQVEVQQTIKAANQEGLPVEPLTHKVHEGIAKNVSEDRIVEAVHRVRYRYAKAYRKAGELEVEPDQEQLLGNLIAGAYAAGLTDPECDRIMAALRTRTRTATRSQNQQQLHIQTMATALTMARRGVSPETISEVLVNALEFSHQQQYMHKMRHAFVHSSRYGTPEGTALRFAQRLSQGGDPTTLSVARTEGDQNDDPGNSRGGPGASGQGNGAGNNDGNGGGSGSSNSNSEGSGGSGGSGGSKGSGGSDSSSNASGSSGNSSGSKGSGGSDSGSNASGSSGNSSDSKGSDGTNNSSNSTSSSGSTSGSGSGSNGGSSGPAGSSGGKGGGGRGK